MSLLKYKVITSREQYYEYSDTLERLVLARVTTKALQDEIDLLTVLIERWDDDHNSFVSDPFADPISILRSLMDDRGMRAKDLVSILGVSKGLVSHILSYRKGLSKDNIRILSDYFKVEIGLLGSVSPPIASRRQTGDVQ
jgi:HTH-type transcriptional regulator/antitoxin HigA